MKKEKQGPVKLKVPCTSCNKLISHGYSSWLSGIFVCEECFQNSPQLKARLEKPLKKKKKWNIHFYIEKVEKLASRFIARFGPQV